jgi:ATP-dependent DNA helicase DinG
VKVIKVGSTFPIKNRMIYPLNIAHLNKDTLRQEEVKKTIVRAVDKIMTHHKDCKGIIHCTSYDQLNFIRENISEENRQRLLKTDPDIERDVVIEEHILSTKPTVLISPSLHLGLDLKDDLSRFQIIVKTSWANLGDRWISARQKRDQKWYSWVSTLRLVQTCGRSVRSDTDWAITYILYSMFGSFVTRNRNI